RSTLTISSTSSDEILSSRKKASVSIAAPRRICGARSFGRPDFCDVDVEFEIGVINLRLLKLLGLSIPSGFGLFRWGLMSALGQKRTHAVHKRMSALGQ